MQHPTRWIALTVLCTATPLCASTFLDRPSNDTFRVATYNVLTDSPFTGTAVRQASFDRLITAINADIFNFQETYNTTAATVQARLNTVLPLPGGASWNVYKGGFENIIASRYTISKTNAVTDSYSHQTAAGLINLPDATFPTDVYLLNMHLKAFSGATYQLQRQVQAEAAIAKANAMRRAGATSGIAVGTPIIALGDLNLVDTPEPLQSLATGNITQYATYGANSPPDWDGTANTIATLPQNAATGGAEWTWRDDTGSYAPSRLDYVTYSDSRLELVRGFTLNTMAMSAADLAATGLQSGDSAAVNAATNSFDHIPLVADFRVRTDGVITARWLATGTGATTWGTNTRWSTSVVPSASIPALVDNGSVTLVEVASNATAASLYLSAGGEFRVDSGIALTLGGALTINPTPALATQSITGSGVIVAKSINIQNAFALSGSILIDNAVGASALTTLNSAIASGQITVPAGASTASGLAIVDSSTLNIASFKGVPLDGSYTILSFAKLGDANLDSSVNFNDLLLLAAHYGETSNTNWAYGDFDRNGTVNFGDLLSLAGNYGATSTNFAADWAMAQSLVPEPGMIGLTGVGLTIALRRRPR
ncbi:MAG: endonuclease/exonuclease/phosphatase family protein [Tepidisphaeraceae bacterium]